MKLHSLKASLIALLCVSSVKAATTVGLTNFVSGNTENSVLFRDSNGLLLDNGGGSTVAVGFFSTLADGELSGVLLGDLTTDFQSFASGTFQFGSPTVDGLVNVSLAGGTIDAASPFANQSIYVLIRNADDSAWGVFKSTETFSIETPGTPGSETVQVLGPLNSSNALVGSIAAGGTIGSFNFNQSLQLAAAIPEPSVVLLGALGLVGLVRRRR